MPKLKVGDRVKLPYVYTSDDVLKIIVETVNDVTGVVQEVKLIKKDGSVDIMKVSNIIVVSANVIFRIISFFQRLLRKR